MHHLQSKMGVRVTNVTEPIYNITIALSFSPDSKRPMWQTFFPMLMRLRWFWSKWRSWHGQWGVRMQWGSQVWNLLGILILSLRLPYLFILHIEQLHPFLNTPIASTCRVGQRHAFSVFWRTTCYCCCSLDSDFHFKNFVHEHSIYKNCSMTMPVDRPPQIWGSFTGPHP